MGGAGRAEACRVYGRAGRGAVSGSVVADGRLVGAGATGAGAGGAMASDGRVGAVMAGTGVGSGAASISKMLAGNVIRATRPGSAGSNSRTSMPSRAARRPTTKWPRYCDGARSNPAGFCSFSLASASCSSVMPMPWSMIERR
jgi:hypothetical protein